MGIFDGILGSVAGSAVGNFFGQDRQEDSQSFNAEQAAIAHARSIQMYQNRYQWSVEDLKKAGLNPMLAYGHGPGSAGSGAQASGSPASPGPTPDIPGGIQATSAADYNRALTERVEAEKEKLAAETREINERTPTHAVTRDSLNQGIQESQERIRKIIQDTSTSAATAQNLQQQTQNLQEIIPQIRAQTAQLHALAKLNLAHVGQAAAQTAQLKALEGLTREQMGEVQQRVRENLPQLDAALRRLEQDSQKLAMPRRYHESGTQEGYLGALSATLKALNPFSDFLKPR